jgi:FkbH-like protein
MTADPQANSTARKLTDILDRLDGSPAGYLRTARELGRLRDGLGLVGVRASLVATFTIDVLSPYLMVEGARRGLYVTATVAPFNQLEQVLLDEGSAVYASQPQVIVVAVRIEDAARSLAAGFAGLSVSEVEAEVSSFVGRVGALLRGIRERSKAQVLLWNQLPPQRLAAGLADPSLSPSQSDVIADVNHRLARECSAVADAHVFDAHRVASEVGLSSWHDPKLWHLARVPFGATAQIAVARRLARQVAALFKPPCKCLVLDLDNTLWGGVLGEDGIGGIALGEDYPGSVFKEFQRTLRSYLERGVLLAIASKNNESDVLELFASHSDLVLRLEDFASRQIHWNDKASSLAAIAAELNIGTDALAFFDDSPVEREWVRSRMPEVTVIDVPAEPIHYAAALEAAGAFDTLLITEEDRQRNQQYRGEKRRRELADTSGSVEDFLRDLGMRVVIGEIDDKTLPRVVQLMAKTNQFNTTTRRHARADVQRMLESGAIGLWMRVEDRFGDNGLVGVAVCVPTEGGDMAIDTFLMSCRVLGRQVEHALLWALGQRAARRGARTLFGEFVPTKKNTPASRFFADCGFAPVTGREGWWSFDLARSSLPAPTAFQVIDSHD